MHSQYKAFNYGKEFGFKLKENMIQYHESTIVICGYTKALNILFMPVDQWNVKMAMGC